MTLDYNSFLVYTWALLLQTSVRDGVNANWVVDKDKTVRCHLIKCLNAVIIKCPTNNNHFLNAASGGLAEIVNRV